MLSGNLSIESRIGKFSNSRNLCIELFFENESLKVQSVSELHASKPFVVFICPSIMGMVISWVEIPRKMRNNLCKKFV